MSIYRDFDQETLDREYRIRDSIPLAEFEEVIARYAEDSERMRGTLDVRLDVPFGASPAEVMDIFPAGENSPVFVFIHGGYWRMLSQKESAFMAETFTRAGVAVATVNYALAPSVTLDEIVRQCRAAIAWLHGNAGRSGAIPTASTFPARPPGAI